MNNKQCHVTVIVVQYAAYHLHSVILNCSYLRVANENYVCICSMPGRLPQDHIIKSPSYLPLLCGADKLADTKDKRRMISSFMLD